MVSTSLSAPSFPSVMCWVTLSSTFSIYTFRMVCFFPPVAMELAVDAAEFSLVLDGVCADGSGIAAFFLIAASCFSASVFLNLMEMSLLALMMSLA
ncbi:MAG: hypothetical protein GY751_04995 [Bacteroidetes bacterium]|nr:hypothetical protein [Bacteroidota bacterium]